MAVIGYNPTTPGASVTFNSTASAQARLIKTGAYVAGDGDTVDRFYVYIAGGSGGDSILNWAICSTTNASVPNNATVVHSGTITVTAAMKAAPGWYDVATSFTLTGGLTYLAQIAGTSVTGIAVGGDTLAGSGTFRTGSTALESPWTSTSSWGSSGNMAAYFNVIAGPPVFSKNPEADAIGATTTNIKYTSNSAGTGAVVLTAHNASQPSDATFDAAAEAISAAVEVTKSVTGLTAATRYKAWVQIKNVDNMRTTSSVTLLTSNTGATSRIVLTGYNATARNRISVVSNPVAGEIVEVGTITGTGAVDITVDGTVMVDDGVTAFQVYRGTTSGGWDAPKTQYVPAIADSVGVRTVSFLASTDLTTWDEQITGGGTITYSGANNTRATIVNDGTRTFLYKNANVTAGRWYALTADIVSADANFDTDTDGDAQLFIYDALEVSAGDRGYPITSADNGTRRGILFQSAITGSQSFRIGIGAAGNREAGTLVVENVQVNEYGTTQPTYIDKFYDVSGGAVYPMNIHTKYEAASTYVAGVVTQVTPTVERTDIRTASLILNIGDSYGLNDRYPRQIPRAFRTAGLRTAYYNAHIGGQTLAQIRDRLVAELTGANYPASIAPLWVVPKTLVLEGGGNSILDNMAAATVLAQLDECIDLARSNGVENIVLVNIPPFRNYSSFTVARETQALAYNALLGSSYAGYDVYDVRSAVAGDLNTDALSNRANGDSWDYDVGDGLHPTLAASQKIGSGISALLTAGVTKNANPKTWYLPVRWNGNRYSEESDAPAVPAPSSFTATTPITSTTVNLAWTNNVTGDYSTLIERSPNGSTGWVTIATKDAGATTHSEYGMDNATYYYRISTTKAGSTSGYATANVTVSATTTDVNQIFAHEDFAGTTLGVVVTTGSIIHTTDGVAASDPTGSGERVVQQTIVPYQKVDGKLDGRITLGSAKPRHGDEIWCRFYVYITAGSDLYAYPKLKWMRVVCSDDANGSNSQGWPDVYRHNDGRWALISTTENANGGNQWLDESTAANPILPGQWYCHEFYVRAGVAGVDQGGTGLMRFWVNGVLVLEHRDTPTMKTLTDYYLTPTLWTYWNGSEPPYPPGISTPVAPRPNTLTGGNQTFYWKRYACALKVAGVRDDTPHLITDAHGNKMIGPGA